jgi:hypothetical protein
MSAGSLNGWSLDFKRGTRPLPVNIFSISETNGKARIVGAAVRVTSLARADEVGGLATARQQHTSFSLQDTKHYKQYKRSATAHWSPMYPTDFTWYGGDESSDNDDYGGFQRFASLEITPAVASNVFVEYVVLFETDQDQNTVTSPGNYTIGGRRVTHDAGEVTKDVARRPIHKEKPMNPLTHSNFKGPDHHKRVVDGVKVAMETGTSALAVTEAVKPGSVTGSLSKFLSLGEATEAEISAAAADALPALEAAYEFAPLALML